jgi:peptidoglycan/LPS O-acetylase OafA/YrhL
MKNIKQIYWPALDGLRALSVLLVIISHINYPNYFGIKLNLGGFGVHTFFAISGFLITSLLLNEKHENGKVSIRNFYLRRFFRIIPVLLLFLFVLFILNISYDLNISKINFLSTLFFFGNIPNSITHLNITGSWHLGHFWSLTIEEQFYLIYPVLISRLNLNWLKKSIIPICIIVPVINYCYYNEVGWFFSSRILHNIMGLVLIPFSLGTIALLIGSYFAILNFQKSSFISFINSSNKGCFSNPILIYFISFLLLVPLAKEYSFGFSVILSSFFSNILLIRITNEKDNSFFKNVLSSKFMVTIGVLSYSIYVWQQLFTANQPWGRSFKYGGSVFINLLLLAIVSYFSYNYYEKWFLNFKKRFQ